MGEDPSRRVSVVVPCLDAGPMLARCLQSCADQTYADIELLFVDDGSTDGSDERARTFARSVDFPVHVLRTPRAGACVARSVGLSQASGAFVQWLDADDELGAEKLALQVEALEAAPDVDVAYGDFTLQIFRGTDVVVEPFPGAPIDDMLASLLLDMWRPPHAYLLRRATADRLDGMQAWNPACPCAQDREYFTTAALVGARFQYVPNSTVRYNRWSRRQLSNADAATRVRSLESIFGRLAAHAARTPSAVLGDLHRRLLAQPWDLWTVAEEERARAADRLTGVATPLTGPTAFFDTAVLHAIRACPPMTREQLALAAFRALRRAHHEPLRFRDAIDRLAEHGSLVRAAQG